MIKNIVFFMLLATNFFASYKDTGFITFTQPNGVTFTARSWGDEFFWWMRTDSDYAIIDSHNGWYYYATLDSRGEYTATTRKVGIAPPYLGSYQLDRSQARIDALTAEMNQIIQQREERFNQVTSGPLSNPFRLGVILIDFPTSRRNNTAHSNVGYYYDDFNDAIFSDNSWHTTFKPYSTPHPDGEDVYGSLYDYYEENSNGSFLIEGLNGFQVIVNNTDPNNSLLPQWVTLPHEIDWYNNYNILPSRFVFLDTLAQHVEDIVGSTILAQFDVICYLFAGTRQVSGYFNSWAILGSQYLIPEMWGGNPSKFLHIGVNAHEFAHAAFGAGDEYLGRC